MDKLSGLNLDSPEIKSLTSQLDRDRLPIIANLLVDAIKLLDCYSVGAKNLGIEVPAFIINTGLFCYMPRIILFGDDRILMDEYCPFKRECVKIVRAKNIVVAFTDHNGRRLVRDLEGIESRYFQHEVDNILNIDFRTRASHAARIKADKRKLH
jgi:peptide deformylase